MTRSMVSSIRCVFLLIGSICFLKSSNCGILDITGDIGSHLIPLPESTRRLIESGKLSEYDLANNPDISLPTNDLILKKGYPAEIHTVTTDDGYILTLHRIPYSPHTEESQERIPVLVQHGVVASSADWVLGEPGKFLGYILSDAGYDVWLGNFRGNTYSREHVNMTVQDDEFWNFSFDEHGKYDVPAMIDYIIEVTGHNKIFYIGHSMGTTAFYIAMSTRPEYNDKIRAMFSMAPVATVGHMVSPLKYVAPFINQAKSALRFFGCAGEFMPISRRFRVVAKFLCKMYGLDKMACVNSFFITTGFNHAQFNYTLLPVILGHTPAGTSTRNMVHFAQGINSGRFLAYDYGSEADNRRVYGQADPPEYDLGKVTAPVALIWSENDWLAVAADVNTLSSKLPRLIGKFRVDDPSFNHLDFIWAVDADKLVYRKILQYMELF